MELKKEVVLAIWDRDYSWIKKISPCIKITKYNKNINSLKEDHIFLEKNVGRDVHTFFRHIVKNYDSLADYTFFAQDYVEDHVYNYPEIINGGIKELQKYAIKDLGGCWFFNTEWNCSLYCDHNGSPNHVGLPLKRIWYSIMEEEIPSIIEFVPAGHFCVTREHVHIRPLQYYEKILNVLETETESPWCIERFETYIFSNKIKIT
jgi:hypothetical protein